MIHDAEMKRANQKIYGDLHYYDGPVVHIREDLAYYTCEDVEGLMTECMHLKEYFLSSMRYLYSENRAIGTRLAQERYQCEKKVKNYFHEKYGYDAETGLAKEENNGESD